MLESAHEALKSTEESTKEAYIENNGSLFSPYSALPRSVYIICLILYWFGSRMGTTIVMGFSLTLFIGVAASMFTALWVTRNILQMVVLSFIGRYRVLFTPEALR